MRFTSFKNKTWKVSNRLKAQPAAVADMVFAKVNYGPNNIFSMSESGTENTIRNMKLSDIEIIIITT